MVPMELEIALVNNTLNYTVYRHYSIYILFPENISADEQAE
jgi:hypothetical protein